MLSLTNPVPNAEFEEHLKRTLEESYNISRRMTRRNPKDERWLGIKDDITGLMKDENCKTMKELLGKGNMQNLMNKKPNVFVSNECTIMKCI